jgi:branched-chain amino acid transport system ATP-binding protein
MLKVNNIEVIYSSVILVLKGVSLEVPDGKIIALLGVNGAGKTTTLKSISGLLSSELGEVRHGNIEFDGERIDGKSPESIAGRGITQILEGRRLYPHLDVEENLRMGAYLHGGRVVVKKRLEQICDYFPRLRQVYSSTSGYLSGGEQQMMVIGAGLMSHPKLLLLDEPSLGLAPLLVLEIFEIMRSINSTEKVAMLLVEQNARAALNLAEYAYVMENGRIVLDGSAEKLRDNEDIKEFYLGLSEIGKQKSYREVKHYKRRKRWLA